MKVLKQYWPGGLWINRSRDGSLVEIEAVGVLDIIGLLKASSKEELTKFVISKGALVEQILKAEAKEKGLPAVGKVVLIQDLAHVSIRHLNPEYFGLLQEVLGVLIDNYPERMGTAYFVNVPAPRLFGIGWNIAKGVFDDNIKGKFVFITEPDWKPVLRRVMDEDKLPGFLGGTVRDPDDRCSNLLGVGGMVPHSLYRGQDSSFLKATVPARGVFDVDVKVISPGSLISWEFTIKDYDIRFGVFRLNAGEQSKKPRMIEVIKVARMDDAHQSVVSGWIQAEEAGTYFLQWDNSYSIFRAKTLHYKVSVVEQQQEVSQHE